MKRCCWAFISLVLLITACSGTKKIAPKEGRISVLAEEKTLQSTETVSLNKPVSVTEWTSPNANNRNKMPRIDFSKAIPDWKAKGAQGRAENDLPMLTPVVVEKQIYTLDTESVLMARDVQTGTKIWQVSPETKTQSVGLTANKNNIITLDENGLVSCFDTKGKLRWKKDLKTAFRATPVLTNESVYLLSLSNDLWVLNAKTGAERWHYKTNAPLTLLQNAGRLALANGVLVAPFSTGEVVAFNAATGILLWSQDLIGNKVFDAIAGINQISASPIIDNNIVYLIGHGGKTMAVHLQTGKTIWQISRGGKVTPLISGNALFFVDNQNRLLALNKKSGKSFWEISLGKGIWKGPYLVNDQLVLFSDQNSVIVNPENGEHSEQEKRIEGSFPAFTNQGVFFLGDNGVLYHWEKI